MILLELSRIYFHLRCGIEGVQTYENFGEVLPRVNELLDHGFLSKRKALT